MQNTHNAHNPGLGLYDPALDHDSCGIGFVAHLKGKPSHAIIENALSMLTCMEHRGGTGYDIRSGDGAGVLIQIPHKLLAEALAEQGVTLPAPGQYGAGMIFFPKDPELRAACRAQLEHSIHKIGLQVLAYRVVPTDNSTLGAASLEREPQVEQIFVVSSEPMDQQLLERRLFIARKYTATLVNTEVPEGAVDFYVASLSTRTMVFKGQFTTAQVREYYLDLQDERCESALAMHHSRFSTNTFPA
jgi:glutamate synthase (NADPH/NADH) large chain